MIAQGTFLSIYTLNMVVKTKHISIRCIMVILSSISSLNNIKSINFLPSSLGLVVT